MKSYVIRLNERELTVIKKSLEIRKKAIKEIYKNNRTYRKDKIDLEEELEIEKEKIDRIDKILDKIEKLDII